MTATLVGVIGALLLFVLGAMERRLASIDKDLRALTVAMLTHTHDKETGLPRSGQDS